MNFQNFSVSVSIMLTQDDSNESKVRAIRSVASRKFDGILLHNIAFIIIQTVSRAARWEVNEYPRGSSQPRKPVFQLALSFTFWPAQWGTEMNSPLHNIFVYLIILKVCHVPNSFDSRRSLKVWDHTPLLFTGGGTCNRYFRPFHSDLLFCFSLPVS